MNAILHDISLESDAVLKIKVAVDGDEGLGIYIAGYSTNCAADDYEDAIFYLEIQDGKPILRVWADINQEEPTHTIDLSGANVNRRLTRFKGNLYYLDEEKAKHHLGSFEEQAETAVALERKVLDNLWDDRLDAASCSPHFEYEIVS
ncbi:MAG: hypothetical protein WC919_00150 [Candidatus Paceibacterota bacterium]|jgi:hypothetical protein